MKTYNAIFIFPASMNDEAVKKQVEKIQGEIGKAGGVIEATDMLGIRTFARRMHKQESGHYVHLSVKMEPSAVGGLQARLRLNEEILRAQIAVAEKPEPVEAKKEAKESTGG